MEEHPGTQSLEEEIKTLQLELDRENNLHKDLKLNNDQICQKIGFLKQQNLDLVKSNYFLISNEFKSEI